MDKGNSVCLSVAWAQLTSGRVMSSRYFWQSRFKLWEVVLLLQHLLFFSKQFSCKVPVNSVCQHSWGITNYVVTWIDELLSHNPLHLKFLWHVFRPLKVPCCCGNAIQTLKGHLVDSNNRQHMINILWTPPILSPEAELELGQRIGSLDYGTSHNTISTE